MHIQTTWDSKPVKTQYGSYSIVCDGVVSVDGKEYRVHAYATRFASRPEIALAYLGKRSGAAVPESSLKTVREAVLLAWKQELAGLRSVAA